MDNEGLREKLIAITPNLGIRERDAIMALIRQDRRELLERLKTKQATCYDCTHDDIPSGETVNFIDVTAIDAELQRLTGLDEGEADHE